MTDNIRRAMAPTQDEISALPLSSNSKIVQELLGKPGGRALDIGCGDGKFTRLLAGLFDTVSGIDVNARKIDQAKAAAADAGLAIDFRAASAEDIPYADASFDVVAFSNSLHHIPHPDVALHEAARVLKSNGLLYVMEPVPSGNYHEATRLVNDETAVRTQAFRELERLSLQGVRPQREILYRARRTFADFEAWFADQVDRDPKRKARFDAQPDEVRRRFETNAERTGEGFAFDQVFRVNLLRKSDAAAR